MAKTQNVSETIKNLSRDVLYAENREAFKCKHGYLNDSFFSYGLKITSLKKLECCRGAI